jgi:hypothetical protein
VENICKIYIGNLYFLVVLVQNWQNIFVAIDITSK